jgi:type IV pilus assembly protein PilY1
MNIAPVFAYPNAGVIYNSTDISKQTIALGINPQGHLNTSTSPTNNASATGIARKINGVWKDATSPGCLCEGWGVSATSGDGISVVGYADVSSGGIYNLEVKNFIVDTVSISSTVWIKDFSGNPILEVTHKYGLSSQNPTVLFQGNVTITNISGKSVTNVRYNRTMDWDMPSSIVSNPAPQTTGPYSSGTAKNVYQYEFNEYVSHYGVAKSLASLTKPKVIYAGDYGFMIPNPTNPGPSHNMTVGTYNVDFVQNGPTDHGSSFTFGFTDLNCGESTNFMIYYGAAENKTQLFNALFLEGLCDNASCSSVTNGVFSIGENRDKAFPFVFGFKGLSGTALAPSLPTKIASLPGQSTTDENIIHTYALPVLSSKSTVSGPITTTQKYIYQTIFKYKKNKQWLGDVLRYNLLPNGDFDTSPAISAASILQSKLNASSMDLPYSSATSGGRSIWSVGKDDNPICSMSSGLTNDTNNNSFSITNKALLAKLLFNCAAVSDTEVTNVINFVRGRDVFWEGTKTKSDPRPSILGDTFHSEMVLVGPPNDNVSASAGKTTEAYYRYDKKYATFVSSNKDRRKQFYVGANDGMLHAFDEDLNERWAFIPPSVLNKLRDMMGTVGYSPGTGQTNSVFNVDGPITVKDVYIEKEKAWKTILMGGLGYGGKSYYVLDITNPDKPIHLFTFNNDITRRVVEFWNSDGAKKTWQYSCYERNWWYCTTNPQPIAPTPPGTYYRSWTGPGNRSPGNFDYQHLGDTWSKPVIALIPRTGIHAGLTQTWAAVFGGGYGNGEAVFSGAGKTTDYGRYVYVVDFEPNDIASYDNPFTTPNGGATIGKFEAPGDGFGPSNVPFGLTPGLTLVNSDGTSKATYYGSIVYYTDLHGQLWKLNLSKTNLTDPDYSSLMQPIFRTESSLASDRQALNQLASTFTQNGKLYHYFGTGDLVHLQSRVGTNNNRIYGISDQDFPSVTVTKSNPKMPRPFSASEDPGLIKNVDLLKDLTTGTTCSSSNWYTNVYTRTTLGSSSEDHQKVVGRGRLYNGNVAFSVYRPENLSCPIYGSSQVVEFNTENCGSVNKDLTSAGSGLAVAPVTDDKGNIYVAVSNLKPGDSIKSGKDNIFKTTSNSKVISQKIKIKSWREKRNN